MNPHDVSWIDSEIAENEGDTQISVKDSTSKLKKQHRPALGQADFDTNLEVFIFSGSASTTFLNKAIVLSPAPQTNPRNGTRNGKTSIMVQE
jgi:hypothetical protein